jgi:hypothetical protein
MFQMKDDAAGLLSETDSLTMKSISDIPNATGPSVRHRGPDAVQLRVLDLPGVTF